LTLGYWAALLAVLTAYVGLFGQAVGVQREFSGLMAKPWRMVMLHAGAWATAVAAWLGQGANRWCGLTPLDWALVLVIAGCLQTISVRLRRIMRALEQRDMGTPR
jgi:hypothetical protein